MIECRAGAEFHRRFFAWRSILSNAIYIFTGSRIHSEWCLRNWKEMQSKSSGYFFGWKSCGSLFGDTYRILVPSRPVFSEAFRFCCVYRRIRTLVRVPQACDLATCSQLQYMMIGGHQVRRLRRMPLHVRFHSETCKSTRFARSFMERPTLTEGVQIRAVSLDCELNLAVLWLGLVVQAIRSSRSDNLPKSGFFNHLCICGTLFGSMGYSFRWIMHLSITNTPDFHSTELSLFSWIVCALVRSAQRAEHIRP